LAFRQTGAEKDFFFLAPKLPVHGLGSGSLVTKKNFASSSVLTHTLAGRADVCSLRGQNN
jgi:hypothetical protein